ncbi:MAG: asparagine synthase (glutamine-hydrolyzing), partial [Candidatus Eisenbacteria bacterium]
PDGEGLWIDGPVGLGMRRLAIVDVAGGHQPMANEDETVWIVYNGEVYNHAALRPGLERHGHSYRTRSDTETIVHMYEEEGERCVEQLQGMFAFALWDRPRGRLLLARDRLGIKPLYYACTDDELLFASEIKAILAGGSVRPALNEAILPEFLATGFVAGPETFFRGVRKLPPGRTLSWSRAEGFAERRYWRLPADLDDSPKTLDERASEVRARLETAVRSHLMSDVPLGLFLSGGIDSSGLAALMAPMVKEPIRTFAVGFDDPEANELTYARLAARSVGAEHREVVVSPHEFFDALPQLVWHEDEPITFPSSIALHFVSRLAREHVKVVLTGEGADELFLGYPRHWVTAWNERLGRVYWASVPARAPRAVLRELCGVPRERPAPAPGGSWTSHRAGPVRRQPSLLRGSRRRDARADEPHGSPDVPGRAPDEAGSDEHGRLDRKPGAVPGPPVRRTCGGDPRPVQAPRLADQGRVAGRAARSGAARNPLATEDGLPRSRGPMVSRAVLAGCA